MAAHIDNRSLLAIFQFESGRLDNSRCYEVYGHEIVNTDHGSVKVDAERQSRLHIELSTPVCIRLDIIEFIDGVNVFATP